MPTGDTTSAGGAIDTTTRIIFDDATIANSFGPNKIALVSTLGGDTATWSIYGRTVAGVLVNENLVMAGTAPVTGLLTYDRILSVGGAHSGTVTVRQGGAPLTTLATMESGVNSLRRPFYNVVADAAGGTNKVFYEKVFLKNTNDTLTLTSAIIGASSSGLGALTTFAIASGYGDSQTIANRLTAPTGVTAFSNTGRTLVDGNFPAGSGVGTWLRLQLDAGTAAQLGIYTMSVSGNSI